MRYSSIPFGVERPSHHIRHEGKEGQAQRHEPDGLIDGLEGFHEIVSDNHIQQPQGARFWRPRLTTCSITSALKEGSDRDAIPEIPLEAI
jgi:hypothetical protein